MSQRAVAGYNVVAGTLPLARCGPKQIIVETLNNVANRKQGADENLSIGCRTPYYGVLHAMTINVSTLFFLRPHCGRGGWGHRCSSLAIGRTAVAEARGTTGVSYYCWTCARGHEATYWGVCGPLADGQPGWLAYWLCY